jgi:hypothetical protein
VRELIQGEYAETAKAVVSAKYNETHFNDYLLAPEIRSQYDSMDIQKEQFATQIEAVVISDPNTEKTNEKTADVHKNEVRWREPVESENERTKIKNSPRVFSNIVIEKQAELHFDAVKEGMR